MGSPYLVKEENLVSSEPFLESLKNNIPYLAWGQFSALFPFVSKGLIEVYLAPGSTAGIERNYKIGKKVLSQRRCRLIDLTRKSKLL